MAYLQAVGFAVFPNIGGWAGAFLTSKQTRSGDAKPAWYDTLRKPWFTPPKWVFGPVWTSVYTGMGYASYLVYRDGGGFDGDAQLPLLLYGSQLLLNWSWTPIFFHCHQLKWSMVTMAALYANVVACGAAFYHVNPVAGLLFIPYVAWLSIAAPLNFSIWQNNKDKDGVKITEVTDEPKKNN